VLASPQWGGFHPMVGQFEEAFAAFQQARFGVSAFNGTVTLEAMLAVLGIGPGDEVIVPAISFVATAMAVSKVGALPVFVDIGHDTLQIEPAAVAAAITPKTRAVLAVHFGGPMADMNALREIARQHNVALLEDAAHAHGSAWEGTRAGTLGLAGSFSFQNGKVMTAGEGGLITTNDEALAAGLRSYVNQGRQPGHSFFNHFTVASNLRLTGLQAAILIAQLERLPQQIAHRRANEQLIKELLAGIPGLRFQRVLDGVTEHSHYLLCGSVESGNLGRTRDQFHAALAQAGVPCTPFYPHTLYQNPLYQQEGSCRVHPCPQAEACLADSFWFPHRVLMGTEHNTREIAAAIRQATGRD
jgi:dTDP-4-amino-4,6-dideoxygalactose transaminase